MNFNDEQFAVVAGRLRMGGEESDEPRHELWDDFRVVVELDRHNAPVVRRRVGDDAREVAVQGEQNGAEFLRLGDDSGVRRADRQYLPQRGDVMAVGPKMVGDFRGDAWSLKKRRLMPPRLQSWPGRGRS